MKSLRLCLVLGTLLVANSAAFAADRMHDKVLAAFREVVAEPSKSTVQVYCDGYRTALGTVVRSDGYVVTKSSELKGKVECLLHNARENEKKTATIVAQDESLDLAVLKIDATDLPVISWSETVPALGSWLATPGMEANPRSVGVLSVAPRKIAAPSAALGIQLANRDNVAQIEEVVPEMAADHAGLKAGDIIVKVNDKDVAGRQQLVETIRSYMPGAKISLRVKRGSEELTLNATLGSLAQLVHGERADFQNNLGGPLSERRAGFASVIQHDSILRPADCGGPLVDLDGKAVGLNIARAGRVESYALPAALVKEAVAKLLETHQVAVPAPESAAEPAPVKAPAPTASPAPAER